MSDGIARYPGRAPIDAYGNGGFRFADMSHRGSLLCLPSGIYAWEVSGAGELSLPSFARVLAELAPPHFLLLGTGEAHVRPPEEIVRAFVLAGIGLEYMTTGAAARTYNILLAESRPVAAALIAVA